MRNENFMIKRRRLRGIVAIAEDSPEDQARVGIQRMLHAKLLARDAQ